VFFVCFISVFISVFISFFVSLHYQLITKYHDMTNTSYLATSVEASRLRCIEEGNDFFYHSTRAEQRAFTVSQAIEHWAPSLAAHHLGADKFVVLVEPGSEKTFDAAFHITCIPGFQSQVLNPLTCFIRCPIPAGESPERYVLEEVALAFMPF